MKVSLHLSVILTIAASSLALRGAAGDAAGGNIAAPILGEPWQRTGVGAATFQGEATIGLGRMTIRSSGSGVGGKQDSFEYVHQPWIGNMQFVGRIAAVEGPRQHTIAGLMARGGEDAKAAFFMVGLNGEGQIVVASRAQEGQEAHSMAYRLVSREREIRLEPVSRRQQEDALESSVVPGTVWLGSNCWFKVERSGEVFSAFASTDGNHWYWLGTERVPMREAEVGIALAGFEGATGSRAEVESISLGTLNKPAVPVPPTGAGDGLWGVYEDRSAGVRMERLDPAVDFVWGLGGPGAPIGSNVFHARWEGMLEAQYTETYAITVVSDDGTRLWLDDRLLIDQWQEQMASGTTMEVSLEAGRKYSLRLDYFEQYEKASVQLYWSSPSTPRQIIPQSQLYSQLDRGLLVDSDRDEIPDRWERTYGLNPNNAADAREDLNQDGVPNRKEYLAGIDPSARRASTRPAEGWESRDIGAVRTAGSGSVSGDEILISSFGEDVFERNDAFHFVYQPWRGDVQIVARVDGLSAGAHQWAKGGIMIREDLTDRSKNVFVAMTGDNGITAQQRTEFGGATGFRAWWGLREHEWIKLIRRGNSFEMYASQDGTLWEWLSTLDIPMEADVFVGLAVTTHNNPACSAQFSRVKVGTPDPPKNPNAASGLGDGLRGTYRNLTGATTVQRKDASIDFDWGSGEPAAGIHAGRFVATWEGKLEVPYNETYYFRLALGDRARFWINGELLIDWTSGPEEPPMDHEFYGQWLPAVRFARLPLRAGHQYDFKLEYHEEKDSERSLAMLYWSSPSVPAQPIPRQFLYSPEHPNFNRPSDRDGDGMPDAWERAFGLNPDRATDANQDGDRDGLTNLQEYGAGGDPWKADTDEDGIPDAWAVRYGLNPGGEPNATQDLDWDGLTNLQEYKLGTDPNAYDTDRDGLQDLIEITQTDTDPINSEIESVQTVLEVPGNAVAARLGEWAEAGTAILAESRRGYVEYELAVPAPDMYRVEIQGGSRGAGAASAAAPLILTLDGDYVGRFLLRGYGSVETFTPWLPAGPHRLRVFWDNASRFSPALEITSIRLVALKGKDRDQNGISGWVDRRLRELSGLSPGVTNVVQSYVSPFTLEGRERFLGTLKVSSDGKELKVHPGARPGWYVDVPLRPYDTTPVDVSFQNGGLRQAVQIAWVPLDIAKTDRITIRRGDSLLLSVGASEGANAFGVVNLSIPGVTNVTGTQPIRVQFDNAGTFTVTGTRLDLTDRRPHTLQVTVVEWAFAETPAAWVGKQRGWTITNDLQIATVEAGEKASVEEAAGPASATLLLQADETSPHHVVARLGAQGPILSGTEVKAFRLFSGMETETYVIKEFPDGSQLVEMGIVMSPLLPQVRVNVRLVVGGVLFEDGTIEKNLSAEDFNELGQASVRFIRPLAARTSVCHRVQAFDGSTRLSND